MCAMQQLALFHEWTSSAVGFRARTSPARALALALLAAAQDCGVSSLASSANWSQHGSSSKTSQAAQSSGSMSWCATWDSLAMKRYRSRLRQAIAELHTCGAVFSWSDAGEGLPTLTRKGNLLAPSMAKWASHERLHAHADATRPEGAWQEAPGRDGSAECHWRTAEPPVVRVVHGLPRGLDRRRIAALGNAVVPQRAEVVGEVMRELMNGT